MQSIQRLVLLIVFMLTVSLAFFFSCSSDSSTEPEPCSTLSIETVGLGIVHVSPDSGCYHSGTTVDLIAVPSSSWLFDSWSGNVNFSGGAEYDSAIVLTVGSNDLLLTAAFVEGFTLAVNIDPANSGTVDVDPEQDYYAAGSTVTLTPSPAEDYEFSHWTFAGDDSSYTFDPLSLTFGEADEIATAHFVRSVTLEGEPDCGTDYEDTYNGGCNSDPEVFLSIDDGQIYSGTSGTYLYDSYNNRDTDWYEYTATGNEVLIFKGEAEFPLLLFIMDGTYGCEYLEVLDMDTSLTVGDTVIVSANVEPGTYWMWVGPMEYSGWDCPLDYTVWFDSSPAVSSNKTRPIGISRQELSNSQQ